MTEHIDFQTIEQDGKPVFAVVPFDQFQRLMEAAGEAEPTIPHDVVKRMAVDDISPAKAWREHLSLSQAEVAERMGVSQPAYAQMEKHGSNPRKETREKIATALGIKPDQLDI